MKNFLTNIQNSDILPRNILMPESDNILIYGISQSGKTTFVFDFLQNSELNFLYVNFEVWQNPENKIYKILKKLEENSFDILVLDIHKFNIKPHLKLFARFELKIIIISWIATKIQKFKQIEIFPLNFEEFISFKNGMENIENSFLRYSQTGGFPIFAKYSEELLFSHLKRLLHFSLSKYEIRILEYIADNVGISLTVRNIYLELKSRMQVSKDKLYPLIKGLIEKGYILAIPEFQKKFHKKYYLMDHSLQNSFSGETNFLKLFENMVISELRKREKIGIFYRGIDFYIEKEKKGILSLPFIELETLQNRISKNISDFQKLNIKKLEIVTMDLEAEFSIKDIQIEALPFLRWALL
jgi:predicted AAA+ superfamily ATPase